MKAKIERSIIGYYFYSLITLLIYPFIFWGKYAKDINDLCEGDGKKTMKFKYVVLLSIITVGIFWFIWRFKVAKRLKENAERYDLKFREGGVTVVILTILGIVFGDYVLIKNFNKMAKAYNDYNALTDEANDIVNLFGDEE